MLCTQHLKALGLPHHRVQNTSQIAMFGAILEKRKHGMIRDYYK